MQYQIAWLVAGRILLIESTGVANIQDWKTIQGIAYDAIEEAGRPPQVHVIHQVIEHHEVNDHAYRVGEMRDTLRSHALLGWVVIVTEQPDPILRFITSVVAHLLRQPLRIVPTLDDALKLLKRLDLTLDTTTGTAP